MSDYKIGEASWDDEDVSSQRPMGERKKIPFLKMENEKSYKLRIISKPYRYYAKWVKLPNNKQIKLNSSLTEDCPLNADGKEAQPGWYVKVLLREGPKVTPAVLDFGKQILKAIKAVQANPDYGPELHTYDITISKGKKGTQPLYTVLPSPQKALTDEEKEIAKKINKKEIDGKPNPDFIDLEERCKPLSVETLRKILSGEAKAPESTEAESSSTDENGVFGDESSEPAKPAAQPKPAPKAEAKAEAAAPAKGAKKKDDEFLDF